MPLYPLLVCIVMLCGINVSFAESINAILEAPVEKMPPPRIAACDQSRVLENMRWFNRDAPNSSHTAKVRGIILRRVNSLDADSIREAYKDGQRHNSSAARLIDDCDDQTVIDLAYKMAEEVRIQRCGAPMPASSASCNSGYLNIRWALHDAGMCSNLARVYITAGLNTGYLLHVRADLIRRGVKVAEGHAREVYDSVDYIGDALLVQLAEKVVKEHSIVGMDTSYAIDNYTRNRCPGFAMVEKNE